MTPVPQFTSISEVLANLAHGGLEWASRYVMLNFNGNKKAWVTIYPIQGNDSPYFDFAYLDDAIPQERFAEVLASFTECKVIDWSPGRFVCIQADRADVTRLTTIITAVAKAAFGIDQFNVDTFYENMQRA